jgi:hypothetical protein
LLLADQLRPTDPLDELLAVILNIPGRFKIDSGAILTPECPLPPAIGFLEHPVVTKKLIDNKKMILKAFILNLLLY